MGAEDARTPAPALAEGDERTGRDVLDHLKDRVGDGVGRDFVPPTVDSNTPSSHGSYPVSLPSVERSR